MRGRQSASPRRGSLSLTRAPSRWALDFDWDLALDLARALSWALALCCTVGVGCSSPKGPESCLVSSEECPPGTFCDAQTQRCISESLRDVERCRLPIDCPDAARPLCQGGLCSPCTGISDTAASDMACRGLGQPLLNICVRSGPRKGQCGECRTSPQCSASDPQRPVCIDGLCRACEKHSECSESGICNDGSGLIDVPGVEVGHCVPADRVIFVDAARCPAGGTGADGSQAKPFCELSAAAGKGSLIHVAPRPGGTYAAATFSDGKRSIVVGPGRDGSALLSTVSATGTRTALCLVDVAIGGSATVLSCSAGAQLRLLRSAVLGGTTGLDAQGCDRIDISESKLARSKGPAIRIGSGTRSYRVVNSLLHDNAGSPAVSIVATASGPFIGNTLINNGQPGIDGGGVSCEGAAVLADSLIVQNGRSNRTDAMGNPLGTQFVGACKLSNVVVGVDAAGVSGKGIPAIPDLDNLFQLKDTPNNDACCVDKAMLCEGEADYFGNRRKQGERCDLGAHELR